MSQAKEKQDANTGRGKKRKAGSGPDGEGQEQQSEAAPKKRAKCARHCKGCKQKIAAEDCAPNFPGCWKCKRALDNIYKLATKQGKEAVEFVKKQREDPDLCFNMVQSYLELCPECCDMGGAKNKKRGTWSLAKYRERTVAASGFVKDAVGEMMHKRLYTEFAMTVRGGRKTEEQIAATWSEWEQRALAKDPELFFDYGGENGALRIWVKTADQLSFRSSFMQEKEAVVEVEQKKNATQADVDRMKAKSMSNHDPIADQIQICQALVRHGDAAFQGNDGFLVDVMDLAKTCEAKAASEEAEGPAKKGDGEEANGSSPEKPAKPWVDRDRVISATVRSSTTQINLFKTKLEKGLKDHKASLEEHKSNPDAVFQKNFAGEIKILANRVEALTIILEVTAEIVAIRAPMTQLLAATSRADKAVKSAVEQLKKQTAKQQADASKPKKPAGQAAAQVPVFDQGVAGATAVQRVAADCSFDMSKPFSLDCSSWVSELMKDGAKCRQCVDSFRDSFNDARKKSKGARVSKAVEDSEVLAALQSKVDDLFLKSGRVVARDSMTKQLQDALQVSLFGIDASYDKVSGEFLGCAVARLSVEGTRTVVMTEVLQLQGFMQRKGIAGLITLAKMSAFFRAMNVAMIQDYQKECVLWSCTMGPGDFLYVPYGFVQAELVQQPTVGVRVPLVCKHSAHENSSLCLSKRKADCERQLAEKGDSGGASAAAGVDAAKLKQEIALLSDLSTAIAS
ncbi:unnamed protein product [Durusdinium trenchii]|uniref:Uncharacterized protein n=1 Tax=Durusdinium trenchii TaxID=1381693 RepID=A0ABP0IEU1_9DINO